jgi:hypothetical protein
MSAAAARDALSSVNATALGTQHDMNSSYGDNLTAAQLTSLLHASEQRNATDAGGEPENVAQAILVFYAVLVRKCRCQPGATRTCLPLFVRRKKL